jgi:outer membrane protein assembly complex protein YaeT
MSLRPGFRDGLWRWQTGVVVLLLNLAASSLYGQSAGGTELRSIEFRGEKTFSDDLLRAAIHSNKSRCKASVLCILGIGREVQTVDRNALAADLIRLQYFYAYQGFRDATISLDTTVKNGVMRASFRIQEGEPIRVRKVELAGTEQADSLTQLTLWRLVARLPLSAGQPLSATALEASRDTLETRLRNVGYYHADVLSRYVIPRDSTKVADVGFNVTPGTRVRFGEPRIVGNQRVDIGVIRRMLAVRKGDLYSIDAILRSQRNLFGLEMFQSIDIREDSVLAGDTIVPITVTLQEGNLRRMRLGFGVTNNEFFNAEARWTHRNFNGGARRLEVRIRPSNIFASYFDGMDPFTDIDSLYTGLSGSFTIDFTQPWFYDLSNNLNAGLFVERRGINDVFLRTSAGLYVSVSRTLGIRTNLTLGYQPEWTELQAADDIWCRDFLRCEANDIQTLRDLRRLAPLTLSFLRDRSNSLFAPTRGYVFRADAEFAEKASWSEFGYVRLAGEWTTYREPLRGLVLATRLRPGWAPYINAPRVGQGLHPQKRFFAGGANSVRGFGQYQLGPRVLKVDGLDLLPDTSGYAGFCTAQSINADPNAGQCDVTKLAEDSTGIFVPRPVGGAVALEGNLEARFPLLGRRLGGAAFVDVGQVWSADDRVRLSDLVWTPGVGLRYTSAIGPIRIDVGYNTQGAERLQVVTNKVCVKPPEGEECTPDSIQAGVEYPKSELSTSSLTSLGFVRWGAGRSFMDRLQLHFSIGQAF